jgi:hypothetical protein
MRGGHRPRIDRTYEFPAAAALSDQAALQQRPQVMGCDGTPKPHRHNQFAHAALVVAEKIEHAATSRVGNRSKDTFADPWSAHRRTLPKTSFLNGVWLSDVPDAGRPLSPSEKPTSRRELGVPKLGGAGLRCVSEPNLTSQGVLVEQQQASRE